MTEAARDAGVTLRVMENYLFYEPLQRLKAARRRRRARRGRGLPPEDGRERSRRLGGALGDLRRASSTWPPQGRGDPRCSTTAGTSSRPRCGCSARSARSGRGSAATEVARGCRRRRADDVAWEHENGVRGVWDATLAVDLYLRSDYYTNDERWEVTGAAGFARVNRCTGRGLQQPSLEVYRDGELRSYHALDDDWASSFRASGAHWSGMAPHRRGDRCGGTSTGRSTSCASRSPPREQRPRRRRRRPRVAATEPDERRPDGVARASTCSPGGRAMRPCTQGAPSGTDRAGARLDDATSTSSTRATSTTRSASGTTCARPARSRTRAAGRRVAADPLRRRDRDRPRHGDLQLARRQRRRRRRARRG